MQPEKPKERPLDVLSGQLAEIGRALGSWAAALAGPDEKTVAGEILQRRLDRAAKHIELAVRDLTSSTGDFQALERSSEPGVSADDLLADLRDAVIEAVGENDLTDVKSTDSEGLCGDTLTISISEFVGFLSNLRKSGVLEVQTSEENYLLQLEHGSVIYAHGDRPPPGLRLGEILVKQEAITEEDLQSFFEGENSGEFLGSALLRMGKITEDDLRNALQYQVQQLFHRMHAAVHATFQFRDSVHMTMNRDISLNVTHLLLESARSSDEDAWLELESLEGF